MPAVSRPTLFLITFLFLLTTLAPPGLCPCSLFRNVVDVHPHPFGDPSHPHDHAYLSHYTPGNLSVAVVAVVRPAAILLALLASLGLWRGSSRECHRPLTWACPPPYPPPR